MPDRPRDPAEGDPSPYSLPDAYGPTVPSSRYDELDHTDESPAVTIHDRDAEIDVEPAAATPDAPAPSAPASGADRGPTDPVAATAGPADPDAAGDHDPASDAAATATPSAARSRREIREQRERDQRAGKRRSRPGGKPPRSKKAKWIRRGIAIVVVILLVPVAISYVDYVNKPGSDTLSVRTVEWIRDHGGNGVVNTIERWWYTNNPPPTGGKPDAIKVQGTVTTTGKAATPTTLPPIQHLTPPSARVPTPAADVLPNEGVWQPTGQPVGGQPAVYTTQVRPDSVHTSYLTGVMWLDTKLLRANYVVGLEQPGGGPNPWGSQIPDSVRPTAIAAFNSGFKMDSANGGAYLDGDEIVPLRAGAASLVINQDGSANVGEWGRDFNMAPTIQAVRQNLALMVDNGQLNPGLREDDNSLWGATLGGNALVWRSGVGVTADGALLYVGGPALSIISLARTLQAAGAVRAMEMDINTDWVSAFTYQPNTTVPGNPIEGVKLLDGMTHDGSQYLQPNTRDFFAFTSDPKAVVPTTTTTTKPKK